jgi:phage shock protein C
MQDAQPRPTAPQQDNLLGICHAIGTDLGFNPIYLRISLAIMLLFSPLAMMIAYGAAGVLVLASRLLVRPKARRSAQTEQPWVPNIPMVSQHRVRESIDA